MINQILRKLFIVLFILVSANFAWALTSPQDPATESTIVIAADGIAPFDATTSAPAGTDANDNNGVVRNFDSITYLVEVTLNDADDTNVNATVTLNDKGSWLSIPADCNTIANGFNVTPDSSISDTTGDGLNDTLFCNLGDHTEGTKLSFRPVAQAVGNNTDIVQAEVESNSENNVNTGGTGTTQSSGPVETEITAGFGVSIGKSVSSIPLEDESDYTPPYHPVGSLVLGSEEGKVIEWHVALRYNQGSEFVQDIVVAGVSTGTQNFTITDTWVGSHSNDPSVEGDNANLNFNDRVIMLGEVTGNPADNCSLVGATAVGTVTCRQGGTAAAPTSNPGAPIIIEINGVPVNQSQLALVQVNMFIPYDDVFIPPPFSQAETYNVDNTATLTGWGGEDGMGAGLPILSATDAEDFGPDSGSEDFLVSANRPNPGISYNKTFDNIGNNKSGQRAAARGEIIATSITMQGSRAVREVVGVCDTLDTNFFEFAGAIMGGGGQRDAIFQGVPSFGVYALEQNINDAPRAIHESYNPKVTAYNNLQTPSQLDVAFASDGSNEGLKVEFSSVPYDTAAGEDHWNATCQDDLDGDPTTTDWSTNYTDPVLFPNGAADVVRIRMTWDRNYPDLVNKFAAVSSLPLINTNAIFSFDLKIKEDAPIADRLPNTAASLRPGISPWSTLGVDSWLGTTGGESGSAILNVQDDSAEPLFSFNTTNADRVLVLSTSMGITKANDPISQPPVMSGDTVSFTIDPRTAGSNADLVTMTFTDTLPNGLSYLSNDCTAVYAAVGLTCTFTVSANQRVITFTVPGYQLGDDLPAFTIQATVDSGTAAGTYTNDVVISSNFADLTDDSHCDDAVDRFGNITTASIANCEDIFSAPHEDSASVLIVSQSGIRVRKSDGVITTQPLANFANTLTYENLGGTEIGIGHLIDILPYNGDGGDSTLRFNSENPTNANTSTMTIDPDMRTEFVSITPSGAGETFEYTITASSSLDHRPCHPSNWPAGDALGSGNATLDVICTLGLIDPATDLPTSTEVGTGSTVWTAAPPANLSDVTGIRATLPVFPPTEAQRDIILTLNASSVLEGNLYCNNFGLNSDVVTLDIISNDVCLEVVTGSISDTVYFDIDGDGVEDPTDAPFVGIVLTLEDSAGNPILIDPVTGAVVPFGTPGAEPYTVTTDSNGQYSFDNLPAGDYIIVVDPSSLPSGITQTDDPDGLFDSMSSHSLAPITDADGNIIDVEDDDEQDFGYTAPLADLGDSVFLDDDQDGIQDPGESGVSGVTVNLYDAFGNLVATTTTGSNGNYLFEDVIPGDYTVEFIPPSGFLFSPQDAGPDGNDSDANPLTGITSTITMGLTDILDVGAGVFQDSDDFTTLWNGICDQGNFLSLSNSCAMPVTISVNLNDRDGSFLSSDSFSIPANGHFDYPVSDMSGFSLFSYGVVTVNANPGSCVVGSMGLYTPGDTPDAINSYFSTSLEQQRTGTCFASFNIFNPSLDAVDSNLATSNWLQIANLDTAAQVYTVNRYNFDGNLVDTDLVSLAPLARQDIAIGHDEGIANQFGFIEILPANATAPYIAQLFRYGVDGTTLAGERISSFSLGDSCSVGSTMTRYANVTRGAGAFSWLELHNISMANETVTVDVLSNSSGLVSSQSFTLGALQTLHTDVTASLMPGESGVAVISGSGANSLLAKSTIYYYRPDMRVSTAYTMEAGGLLPAQSSANYNTFLSQFNWLRLHNISATPQSVTVEVFDSNAISLGMQVVGINPSEGADVDLNGIFALPANTLGQVVVTASGPGVLYGDLLRIQYGASFSEVNHGESIALQ